MDLEEKDLKVVMFGNRAAYVEHTPTGIGHLCEHPSKSSIWNKAQAIKIVRQLVEAQFRPPIEKDDCDEAANTFNIRTNDPIAAVAQLVPVLKKELSSVGRLAGRCHDGSSFSFRFKR